jgi:hypothetical protein
MRELQGPKHEHRETDDAAPEELIAAGTAVAERHVQESIRPEGELLFHDHHPLSWSMDDSLHWRGDYFGAETPPGLGRLVTDVIEAGLVVQALEEFPATTLYPWLHQTPHVPREFLLIAGKP